MVAGQLWSELLRQLRSHRTMTATRDHKLGRTAALLLLGLVRVEQQQAPAVSVMAGGGPAVAGVVELQVSSKLVSENVHTRTHKHAHTYKHKIHAHAYAHTLAPCASMQLWHTHMCG